MNSTVKRIIVAVLVAAYIINPIDLPGPIDDIAVTVIGMIVEYKLKNKQLPENKKDDEDQSH
ncbi:MAG: hypothetical protein IKN85_05150 [Oscillospiraceae bacterium]|nr:hypothetical protein [Oscillospiraceae bacterium]